MQASGGMVLRARCGSMTMATRSGPATGDRSIAEIKEFAGFSAATQRYIRRSLDIGLARDDAIARWSRDRVEETASRAQEKDPRRLANIPRTEARRVGEGRVSPDRYRGAQH